MNNEEFDLVNLPIEAQDESIKESDFQIVGDENRTHEQRFQTKPTTFFKDSIKRFSKNKSSVAAAGILGVLLLLSVFVPIFDRSDVKDVHPEMIYLQPKIFESGAGFMDGTKKWENIAVDVGDHPNATDEAEKQEFWWPSPNDFNKVAISKKTFSDLTYTSNKNEYASGGYVQFGISGVSKEESAILSTHIFPTININGGDVYLKSFVMCNLDDLNKYEDGKAFFPENYVQGKASLNFDYYDGEVQKTIKILDDAERFEISDLNLTEIIKADSYVIENNITTFNNFCFSLKLKKSEGKQNECVLIKNFELATENIIKADLEKANFSDANEFSLRDSTKIFEPSVWLCNGNKKLHMAKVIYCSFYYDSYQAAFGRWTVHIDDKHPIDGGTVQDYVNLGWLTFSYVPVYDEISERFRAENVQYEILSDKCPLKTIDEVVCVDENNILIVGELEYYRFYGYDKMPKFIMGTDSSGRDMLKYVFEGLRTSLLLGICSFVVCFVIGLIWGSVSGYFGGAVDMIMERFTDILSGLPWIVVMTLVIEHFGKSFFVFGLAICLTGWIGTASTTRTQFYRFRGREYVLASRSLGASDARLIAKHILPNAMGTIITSSVLMIPSVIFSEATISYLGLGLKGMSSLGVILSDNQSQLTTHPYLLIFPSVIIALLMISFNLFGNGLRDAVNPSLKGEEQ